LINLMKKLIYLRKLKVEKAYSFLIQ